MPGSAVPGVDGPVGGITGVDGSVDGIPGHCISFLRNVAYADFPNGNGKIDAYNPGTSKWSTVHEYSIKSNISHINTVSIHYKLQ